MNHTDKSDKEFMVVDDPRDAFIFMLMERIEHLEDRLNRIIEPKLEYLNQERLRFECQTSAMSNKATKTFTIQLYHYSKDLDVIMSLSQSAVNEVVRRMGVNSLVSVSAVIEIKNEMEYEDFSIIYINMYRRCWVHETIKALSELKISCLTKIEKVLCSAFNTHVSLEHNSWGYVYSAYDLDGIYNPCPKWQKWEKAAKIYEPST